MICHTQQIVYYMLPWHILFIYTCFNQQSIKIAVDPKVIESPINSWHFSLKLEQERAIEQRTWISVWHDVVGSCVCNPAKTCPTHRLSSICFKITLDFTTLCLMMRPSGRLFLLTSLSPNLVLNPSESKIPNWGPKIWTGVFYCPYVHITAQGYQPKLLVACLGGFDCSKTSECKGGVQVLIGIG